MQIGIALCLLFFALMAQAIPPDTTISSPTVSGTWGLPYTRFFINDDITVPQGQYLHILPGVEVRFLGNYGITALGELTANGMPTDSITFTSNTNWKYIEFRSGAFYDSAFMKYCRLERGQRAVWASEHDVTLKNCLLQYFTLSPVKGDAGTTLTLENCTIRHNGGSGVLLTDATAHLNNTWISYSGNTGDYGHGIHLTGSCSVNFTGGGLLHNNGCGILGSPFIGAIDVTDAEIAHNVQKGIYLTGNGSTLLTAARVLLHHNQDNGIFLNSTSLYAQNLTITTNNGYGLYFTSNTGTLTLNSSIVENNSWQGIYLQNGIPDVSYCDVFQNDSGNYSNPGIPGVGCISLDPQFVSRVNLDYHLAEGSPCIDTGSPFLPHDPDSTQADMGAFFFNQDTTAIKPVDPGVTLPRSFEIISVYPNPFNPMLTIKAAALGPAQGVLELWSPQGRKVADIWQGRLLAGDNVITWNAANYPSGVYLIRLVSGGKSIARSCVLIK
jgi:hypothetical protein